MAMVWTKDYAKAVKWFKEAAYQGNAIAQLLLGICYNEGHGVTQDHVEAMKWFEKSAEQGLC